MRMERFEMFADMVRYVGKTVTVFTSSGGPSGAGFTGVLACVDENIVRLISRIGAPPACPLNGPFGPVDMPWGGGVCNRGMGFGFGFGPWGSLLGAVTEIPISQIVAFTHNAI